MVCHVYLFSGGLFFWGVTNTSRESTMYPKAVQDLCGWKIRSLACGWEFSLVSFQTNAINNICFIVQCVHRCNHRPLWFLRKSSIIIAADESTISWGPSPTFGELVCLSYDSSFYWRDYWIRNRLLIFTRSQRFLFLKAVFCQCSELMAIRECKFDHLSFDVKISEWLYPCIFGSPYHKAREMITRLLLDCCEKLLLHDFLIPFFIHCSVFAQNCGRAHSLGWKASPHMDDLRMFTVGTTQDSQYCSPFLLWTVDFPDVSNI